MPDINVPLLGKMPRGAVLAGGLAVVAVGGYLVYKKVKAKTTAQQPATGTPYAYGYGQYAYGQPGGSPYGYNYGYAYGYTTPYGEYGFGGANPFPTGVTGTPYGYQTITTNAQWGQQAEAALGSSGMDATAAAIAKYLQGAEIDEHQALIVQEAEAILGPPPQAGRDNFPPQIHIKKSNGQTGGNDATNPVSNLHVSKPGFTGVDINWAPSHNATSYQVTSTHGHAELTGPTRARIHDIGRKQSATVQVLAEPAASDARPATITVRTA